MKIDDFFNELLSLQEIGKVDTGLRVMFHEIETIALTQEFSSIDELFVDARIMSFEADFLVGMLVITLPWKSHLKNREDFITIVKLCLLRKYSEKKTEQVLAGLR